MRFNARIAGVAALATVVSGGLAAPVAAAAAETAAPGTGSAFGASASVSLLPGVLGAGGLTVDTGKLAASSTAGPAEASVADVPLRGVIHAKAITSSARNTAGKVTGNAAILDVQLPVLAAATGGTPSAEVLRASCTGTADAVTGSSEIVGLDLGRLGTVPVTGEPNQTIDVPQVARIVLNEQVRGTDGSLTVTALHVSLLGGSATGKLGNGDIRLASATCGLGTAATTPTAPTQPTVTPQQPADQGGHQVSVVPSGAPETGDGTLAASR